MRPISFVMGVAVGTIFWSVVASAWAGPSQAAPNGNVNAPINVGSTAQIKNGSLGVNSLAVFGNTILNGTGLYLNFGTVAGTSGYGIRDNGGTLEFKSTGGSWNNLTNTVTNVLGAGAVSSIKFSDGSVQTTALHATAWVNLIGSRTLGTTYTNTTGYSIEVSVSTYGLTRCASTIIVSGIAVGREVVNTPGGGAECNSTVNIPSGALYYATNDDWSDITLVAWSELR